MKGVTGLTENRNRKAKEMCKKTTSQSQTAWPPSAENLPSPRSCWNKASLWRRPVVRSSGTDG